MSVCPECGCERNEELGYCVACGRLNSDTNEVPQFMRTDRTVKKTDKKSLSIICVSILILSVFAGLVVGGSVDFQEEQDGDDVFTFTVTSMGLFESIEWTVTDVDGNVETIYGGKSVKWIAPHAGMFKVTMCARSYFGIEQTVTKEIIQGGAMDATKSWTYGGVDYTVYAFIPVDEYMKYRSKSINRAPGTGATGALVRDYMEVKTAGNIFESIATQIASKVPDGTSDEDMANIIMLYVSQFKYTYDQESRGVPEYWKFPVETLFDGGGDCEDFSIMCMVLFEMVFEAKGRVANVALSLYWGFMMGDNSTEGHAMATIALPPGSKALPINQKVSNGYEINGKTYYVGETSYGYTPVENDPHLGMLKVGNMINDYVNYVMYQSMPSALTPAPYGLILIPAAA